MYPLVPDSLRWSSSGKGIQTMKDIVGCAHQMER